MIIDCSREFKRLGRVASSLVGMNGKAKQLLQDATLQIGPANDPHYGVPAGAVQNPIFVGDHAVLGNMVGNTSEIEALYKSNPYSVNMKPRFNLNTGKYDVVCSKSGIKNFVGDSGELIAMQTISPWNASFFPEIFRQPLLYSHARDLVKRKTGTNPWGETQALQLAAYSGWGMIDGAGSWSWTKRRKTGLTPARRSTRKLYIPCNTKQLRPAACSAPTIRRRFCTSCLSRKSLYRLWSFSIANAI